MEWQWLCLYFDSDVATKWRARDTKLHSVVCSLYHARAHGHDRCLDAFSATANSWRTNAAEPPAQSRHQNLLYNFGKAFSLKKKLWESMSTLANGQQLPDSSGHGLTGLGAGSRMGALGIGDRRQHAHQNENKSSEQRINEQAFPFMQFQCGHGGDKPESYLCERSSVFTPAGA
jgi:hypothetical protein